METYWMPLDCELAICLLDGIFISRAIDAQHSVVIVRVELAHYSFIVLISI